MVKPSVMKNSGGSERGIPRSPPCPESLREEANHRPGLSFPRRATAFFSLSKALSGARRAKVNSQHKTLSYTIDIGGHSSNASPYSPTALAATLDVNQSQISVCN